MEVKLPPEVAEELRQKLKEAHTPVDQIPVMAAEIWEDGEYTSQKCSNGELYGRRTLHCIYSGLPDSLPLDIFPEQNVHHAFVRAKDTEAGRELYNLIHRTIVRYAEK